MPEQVTFPLRGSEYVPLPRGKQKDGGYFAHAVQTIAASPDEIHRVFDRLELLPTWQEGVVSVTSTGERTQRWVMQDPASGKQLEFDAEVLESASGQRHLSRITSGPFEGTTDTVTFVPHASGRGTVVTWITDFRLPGGSITNAVAAAFSRGPESIIIENLRHLKQLIEAKEIPNVEGQPSGPRGVSGWWKRFLLGENMAPPPGTSDREHPQDLPMHVDPEAAKKAAALGGVAVVAAAAAWYGISKLRD